MEEEKNFPLFKVTNLVYFWDIQTHDNKIIERDYILQSDMVDDIIVAFKTWLDLFQFLSITYVSDRGKCNFQMEIDKFALNVQKFYDMGSRTFISKSNDIGNDGTFYLHALRFYMPKTAYKTFRRHKVGPGIFNMQGFERRNKESKNTLRRFRCSDTKKMVSTNVS